MIGLMNRLLLLAILITCSGCSSQKFGYHLILKHEWVSTLKINQSKELEIVSEFSGIKNESANVIVTQKDDLTLVGPRSKIMTHDNARPISIRDDEGYIYSDDENELGASISVGSEYKTYSKRIFLIITKIK